MCVLALLALAGSLPLAAADTPLPDGSFENGQPPASEWVQVINTPTLCPTAINDWEEIWGLAAPHGSLDFYLAGFCGTIDTPDSDPDKKPIVNSVSQLVTVPSTNAVLKFWFASYRKDVDDVANSDLARVKANDTTIWSYDGSSASSNTYSGSSGGFVEKSVDLCAYAGENVILTISNKSTDSDGSERVANFRFDHFRWADGIFLSGFECDFDGWELLIEP
jgi:hypothetical protein